MIVAKYIRSLYFIKNHLEDGSPEVKAIKFNFMDKFGSMNFWLIGVMGNGLTSYTAS